MAKIAKLAEECAGLKASEGDTTAAENRLDREVARYWGIPSESLASIQAQVEGVRSSIQTD
jgi:hypothetical protein